MTRRLLRAGLSSNPELGAPHGQGESETEFFSRHKPSCGTANILAPRT